MRAQTKLALSPEEYLLRERKSPTKSEYFQGELVCLAEASERHNTIVANIVGELRMQLKGRTCKVYPSDMRLGIRSTGAYTYPDIMVVCGERRYDDQYKDTVLNPKVILEVLSDSTRNSTTTGNWNLWRNTYWLHNTAFVWNTTSDGAAWSGILPK